MTHQPGVLSKPLGVAIFPQTGHITVTEQERYKIALFILDGHLIKWIDREGNEDGDLTNHRLFIKLCCQSTQWTYCYRISKSRKTQWLT